MKSLSYYLIVILALTFTSCTFTEEITFQENGSGAYQMNIDMSNMMDSMKAFTENDSLQEEKVYEKYDSIVYMKDILEIYKDSINNLSSEEQALMESLKGFKMHVQMDEEVSKFLMSFEVDFKNISELDDVQERIKMAQAMSDKKEFTKETNNHEVHYSYKKGEFKRQVTLLDLNEEQQASFDKNIESFNMFMMGSTYKLIYHFPNKIKSCSLEGANISEDKKTLTYELETEKIITNPELLDFELKF